MLEARDETWRKVRLHTLFCLLLLSPVPQPWARHKQLTHHTLFQIFQQAEEKEKRAVAAAEARVRAECEAAHAKEIAVWGRSPGAAQNPVANFSPVSFLFPLAPRCLQSCSTRFPSKIIERREAQLQQDIRSLHDELQLERERSQGLQASTGALERRITELEKENAELLEEYRTTLQLLPGFQPDNPWVL